jgi:hypothetical protein
MPHIARRKIQLADRAEESGNVLVEDLLRSGGRDCVVLDVDAAAAPVLCPALTLKLAVPGTDGVGMNAEAAGKFARAGEAIAGLEVTAENREDHLGYQLAIDRHLTGS